MGTTLITILFFLFGSLPMVHAMETSKESNISWPLELQEKVGNIDEKFEGTFSIYIEDLIRGQTFSYQANQPNYLASAIKIFVLAEIYRLIDLKKLSLEDSIPVAREKYRDGPGFINWKKEGERVTIRKLLEYMIIKSDNAATDILFDVASVPRVEETARQLGVHDLKGLTTMLDVRKRVFRQLHPLAGSFTSLDYIKLWRIRNLSKKAKLLAKILQKPKNSFHAEDIKKAYFDFYKKGYNSASLQTVSHSLRTLIFSNFISTQNRKEIVKLLLRCKTGKDRIRAGLPEKWRFAHKTGTQLKRSCDVGMAIGPTKEKVLISICARDFETRKNGNKQYAQITKSFFKLFKKDQSPK